MEEIHWQRMPKSSKIKGLEAFDDRKNLIKSIKDMVIFLFILVIENIVPGISDKKNMPSKRKRWVGEL